MDQIQLGTIDYAILIVYFAFVLGIGWMLRRNVRSSEDFFLSGRSIPTWIAGLAFLSNGEALAEDRLSRGPLCLPKKVLAIGGQMTGEIGIEFPIPPAGMLNSVF